VSRRFVRASAKALQTLHERRHEDEDWLVLLLDGKSFADDQVVIALGVTTTGEKRILGLVQTATENKRVCAAFLRELVDRGFQAPVGLLVVLDGAKGLSAAVRDVFGETVPIQRCQWHKRENVLSYLPTTHQARWRRKRQAAYAKATYGEARHALRQLVTELESHNASAARSLEEGLDETLTLHRLEMFTKLGIRFCAFSKFWHGFSLNSVTPEPVGPP
jgi:transposase-like protein